MLLTSEKGAEDGWLSAAVGEVCGEDASGKRGAAGAERGVFSADPPGHL